MPAPLPILSGDLVTVAPGQSAADVAALFGETGPAALLELVNANPQKDSVLLPDGRVSFGTLDAGETVRVPDGWQARAYHLRDAAAPALLSDAQAIALIAAQAQAGGQRGQFTAPLGPLVGLNPSDPAYVRAVYPFDTYAKGAAMAHVQSGCGLVGEIGWRAANVQAPVLWRPYADRVAHGQQAVVTEATIAKAAGAWDDLTKPWNKRPIEPFDTVIIGCSACGPGWSTGGGYGGEHLFIAGAYDGAGRLWSIDGGQPGIRVRVRQVVATSTGELWCGQVNPKTGKTAVGADGRPLVGRRVLGIARAGRLPLGPWQGGAASGSSMLVRGALVLAGAAAAGAAAWWWMKRPRR